MTSYIPQTTILDKNWFAAHPGAECYLRAMLPGEFPFFSLKGERHVLITRVADGIRQKHPLRIYTDHNGLPSELVWIDTGERWHVMPSGEVVPGKLTQRQAWQALLPDESRMLVEVGRTMEGGAS